MNPRQAWIFTHHAPRELFSGYGRLDAGRDLVVAVDGGMADNPRPALYHALYTACLADRPDALPEKTVRIVGKFCESGDELIPQVKLPAVKRGDVLAMPVAGAYQLSMASNYNLAPRPAVLCLEEGSLENQDRIFASRKKLVKKNRKMETKNEK